MNSKEQPTNETKQSLDVMQKAERLLQMLESDLDACDFKWTLFVAAAKNYKYDSLLKPFPSAYIAPNKVLCIERLRETIACIPAFRSLLPQLQRFCDCSTSVDNSINDETIDLLYWCLISVREPILKSVNRTNVSIILCNFFFSPNNQNVVSQKRKFTRRKINELRGFYDKALKLFDCNFCCYSFESSPLLNCRYFDSYALYKQKQRKPMEQCCHHCTTATVVVISVDTYSESVTIFIFWQ